MKLNFIAFIVYMAFAVWCGIDGKFGFAITESVLALISLLCLKLEMSSIKDNC